MQIGRIISNETLKEVNSCRGDIKPELRLILNLLFLLVLVSIFFNRLEGDATEPQMDTRTIQKYQAHSISKA